MAVAVRANVERRKNQRCSMIKLGSIICAETILNGVCSTLLRPTQRYRQTPPAGKLLGRTSGGLMLLLFDLACLKYITPGSPLFGSRASGNVAVASRFVRSSPSDGDASDTDKKPQNW